MVFLDTQLVERSLRLRQSQIEILEKRDINTDQKQSIVVQPLNQYFKDFNLASSYEGGVKKWMGSTFSKS